MIEVEVRGFLSKEEFETKLKEFQKISSSFEEDHRDTTFFMLPEATLKVTKMKSKNQSKISYKSGDIVSSVGQEEVELLIPITDYDKAVLIFTKLGLTDKQITEQIRYNFNIDGFEVSLKWSKDWEYHFEVEKLVNDRSQMDNINSEIKEFCSKFKLKPLSEEEFLSFREKVDSNHRSS